MKAFMVRSMMATTLAACAATASAQIYVCRDASGRMLSSDRPIPECANRALVEMGQGGVVRRVIPAPLTPEEKKQKEAEDRKKKDEEAALEQRRKEDRNLRARYHDESDIQVARQRSLEVVIDLIRNERASLAESEKQLAQIRAEQQAYQKKNATPSANLDSKVNECAAAVANSRKLIQEFEGQLAQINAKYDEILKRYREIVSSQAAAPVQ